MFAILEKQERDCERGKKIVDEIGIIVIAPMLLIAILTMMSIVTTDPYGSREKEITQ